MALQGVAIKESEEKIVDLENKVEELEKANRDIQSTMAEISGVIALMKDNACNTKPKVNSKQEYILLYIKVRFVSWF